jgi:hypothetical protein
MAEKELQCPNCGPGTKTHQSEQGTVCEQCGGTFTFAAGEAKVKEVGRLDQLEADLQEIKERLPASTPAAQPEPDPDPENEPSVDDDEEEDQ